MENADLVSGPIDLSEYEIPCTPQQIKYRCNGDRRAERQARDPKVVGTVSQRRWGMLRVEIRVGT